MVKNVLIFPWTLIVIIYCLIAMPVAEILVLGGFLFIYSLEELTHLVLVCTGNLSSGHGHSHEEIEVPVEESIQVRPGLVNIRSLSLANLSSRPLLEDFS